MTEISQEDRTAIAAEVVRMLKAGGKEKAGIDWGAVDLPEAKPKRPQSGTLDTKYFVWITVVSALLQKSIASVLQTAVITYLTRNEAEHLELLDFTAGQQGLTREQAIQQIYRESVKD